MPNPDPGHRIDNAGDPAFHRQLEFTEELF